MSLLSPQLEAFLAITQCGTVHGAAEQIHLTQTAVTQRIRTLEKLLKTTLFIRTRRGMQLTTEGQALLRYCQSAKALEGEALSIIQGAGTQAEVELAISGPTSIMRSRVIPSCLPVIQRFHQLLLHFNVNDQENGHHLLRTGQVDFAVIQEQHLAAEMESKALRVEEYVLVASHEWKGRKLSDIIENERIIDYSPEDQTTFNYLKKYDLYSLANKHGRYFVNRTDSLAFLVGKGLGYTTLAREFAEPYLKEKELVVLNGDGAYEVRPILAWFDRPEPPRYFTEIVKAIT